MLWDSLVHFCQLSALVVTVYDHTLTFDSEVEYIWKRRWSSLKVLFVLARYFGNLVLISVCVVFLRRNTGSFCNVGLKFVGTGSMVVILITQVIMQLRVKVMYGKIMSKLITIFWILEVFAVLSLGVASLVVIDVTPYTMGDDTQMCNPTYLPPFAFIFWVPIIVFETFLFSLALRIAYNNFQDIGTWRGFSLVHIILRDNFIFFVIAFASYIITAVTWLSADPRYFTVPGAFTCAFTTIMGCRLILNLCRAYYQPIRSSSQPQSIWAASEVGRFRPSMVAAHTSSHGNWVVAGENPEPKSVYELDGLADLDRTKDGYR